ncbi:MAG: DUF309 domain-containing protein [Actinomycetales bacterium]
MTGERDRLGRPLRAAASADQAFWQIPERSSISSSETIALAREYLMQDLPFHAHEVFEQRWRCCPAEERPLWKALAQLGAAITHAARGNDRGAHQVGLRGLDGLLSALGLGESGSTGTGVDAIDVQDSSTGRGARPQDIP